MSQSIAADFVRRAFIYNPDTGKIFWAEKRPRSDFPSDRGFAIFHAQFAGKEAFTTTGVNGYKQTRIGPVLLNAHRVAWLLFHGDWPPEQVDHINGDRTDNRIANLRSATHSENCRNTGLSARNRSGRIGVHFDRSRQKWAVNTKVNGKPVRRGRFATFEEACAARAAIEREYNFHPNHGRKAQS